MQNILLTALNNKHTSIAGLVYLVFKFGAEVGAIWMPEHTAQFKSTASAVEGLAVAYGLFAAGDAAKSATKKEVATAIETGDTSNLTKPTSTK